MEMGRNLERTTERHQRGFKVPMEMSSLNLMLIQSNAADDSEAESSPV